jgi:outer membrane receptor for ferrienterochelin and colicins
MKIFQFRFSIKCFYIVTFLLIFSNQVFAQSHSIRGTITDTLNNPIQYVNVAVIGTVYGDASDINGYYEISNLKTGIYSVKFSAIGYNSYDIENLVISDSSLVINVVLKEEVIESEEIIVTSGKYEQKKSELPVSAEVISGTDFLERNFSDMEDALRYVPGINMVDDQISIRGSSGYSRGAGSRVVLALDGIPFYTGDTGETS